MQRFYNFFSSKKASWFFIAIAVVCRIINIFFVSENSRDKIYLALQSKNFLAGNGFSVSKYFAASLETPVYDFTPMWPPGYPLLLAPFLKIFNYNVYWATTTIDILSCVFFIFLVRRIALDLKFPVAAVNIVTLIAGCFDYAFIYESLPTDAPSFVLFLLGFLFLLHALQNETLRPGKLFLASLFLFLPCIFRYSFPPLSIAAFTAVIFAGLYLKNKLIIKKGVIGLSILSLLLLVFFITLKLYTGKAGFIVETERGFFPGNFFDWAPIGPGAFLSTLFSTSQLIKFTSVSVDQALRLLKIISAIMTVGFVILFLFLFFRKKFFKLMSPFKWFLAIGFFIAAATCTSLAYLSITNKPQPGWGNYLGEPRYFMFVTLYLQMAFLGWLFLYPSWKKDILQKLFVFILSSMLFIEVAHSIYFHSKVALNFSKYRTATYKEADYVYFSEMMKPVIHDNQGTDILVAAESDEFYPLMGSYLGQKGIYDGQHFFNSFPEIKKKTIIIFALYDPELLKYQEFIAIHKGYLIDKVNGVNFYRVDLHP